MHPPSFTMPTTAETIHDANYHSPIVTAERSAIASPIGWSSIFGATAIALGVWLVLHLFGIGAGMTAIDPDNASSLRGAGIGMGVWSLIAPIIAIFVGGLVVGRVAPTINTLNAAIHGAVVWALTALAAMMLLAMTVGSLARGVAATGSAVGKAASSAVSAGTGDGGVSMSSLGINADDMVAPINKRLQAQGLPPVKADDLQAAAKEALQTSVRQGGVVDREQLVTIIARRTNLSRADAEQVATQLQQQLNAAQEKGGQIASQAGRTAMQVAETTGKALVTLSVMLTLALAASILGAVISVRRERREHVVLPHASTVA
ncbi:MAG: hypothetical protein H0T79_24175, partial [Deltaproteobacteria bacterium]|nr:hypothetical protein [Deltaproteobacteria bacterium]